jgi:hypothetical protein
LLQPAMTNTKEYDEVSSHKTYRLCCRVNPTIVPKPFPDEFY